MKEKILSLREILFYLLKMVNYTLVHLYTLDNSNLLMVIASCLFKASI